MRRLKSEITFAGIFTNLPFSIASSALLLPHLLASLWKAGPFEDQDGCSDYMLYGSAGTLLVLNEGFKKSMPNSLHSLDQLKMKVFLLKWQLGIKGTVCVCVCV